MHVDIDVLTQLALGCFALYLLWDRNNMTDRIAHLEQQHNKLCNTVGDFAEQVEEEINDILMQLENKNVSD